MKHLYDLYEEYLDVWGKSKTSEEYINSANQAYLFANFLEQTALNLIMQPYSGDHEGQYLWSSVYDAIREDLDDHAAQILDLRDKVQKYERYLASCASECSDNELAEANYQEDKRWYYNQGRL